MGEAERVQRFGEVIRECAQREDTWINREIVESYARLRMTSRENEVED